MKDFMQGVFALVEISKCWENQLLDKLLCLSILIDIFRQLFSLAKLLDSYIHQSYVQSSHGR